MTSCNPSEFARREQKADITQSRKRAKIKDLGGGPLALASVSRQKGATQHCTGPKTGRGDSCEVSARSGNGAMSHDKKGPPSIVPAPRRGGEMAAKFPRGPGTE